LDHALEARMPRALDANAHFCFLFDPGHASALPWLSSRSV
jgi:hypothetical protein